MKTGYPGWLIAVLVAEFVLCASLPVLLYLSAAANMPNGGPPRQFLLLSSEDRYFLIPLFLWVPLALASALFWRWEARVQTILCALAPFPLGIALIVFMLAA